MKVCEIVAVRQLEEARAAIRKAHDALGPAVGDVEIVSKIAPPIYRAFGILRDALAEQKAEDRSFPEAADGRDFLPMETEIWAAGADTETAKFVARMLGEQGYRLIGSGGPETTDGLAKLLLAWAQENEKRPASEAQTRMACALGDARRAVLGERPIYSNALSEQKDEG